VSLLEAAGVELWLLAEPVPLKLQTQLDVAEDQNLNEICVRKPSNATALI